MRPNAKSAAMMAGAICVMMLCTGCRSLNKPPADVDRLAVEQQREHVLRENREDEPPAPWWLVLAGQVLSSWRP